MWDKSNRIESVIDQSQARVLLDAIDLEKTYKDRQGHLVPVLKRVVLRMARGEFLAIRGSSGAGKSTLLNILGCLDRPDAGSYFFDGQNVAQWSEKQRAALRNRRIGFVFQNFHLLPFLSVRENVELPFLYLRNDTERRVGWVEQLLNFMGLTGKDRRYPYELSAGEQQRVAIARALVLEADLILADEPTGNLDAGTAKSVLDVFEQLTQQGKTVLLVTHDSVVAARAHRQLYLDGGNLTPEIS